MVNGAAVAIWNATEVMIASTTRDDNATVNCMITRLTRISIRNLRNGYSYLNLYQYTLEFTIN
jgi:hypothetical protein